MKSNLYKFIALFALVAYLLFCAGCLQEKSISLDHYYDYDKNLPLNPVKELLLSRSDKTIWHITYASVHNERVTALLSFPKQAQKPMPVVIYLHGIGDSKNADYMQLGDSLFVVAGFAVLRIDAQYHGERQFPGLSLNLLKEYPFAGRDGIVQTVFDLRRAVDLLDSEPDVDPRRTGFLGVSLGGAIGSIFVGVEKRIEFPIIALAGGGLKFLFGTHALNAEIRNMLAPIEPLNFIKGVQPRPLLFINAEHDEVVPKAATKALFTAAGKPKEIRWYDSGHIVDAKVVLKDCSEWFKTMFQRPTNHNFRE